MENIVTTPTQENYIETIFALSKSGSVRGSMLAETLGVKRASVSKYISTLVEKGFIEHAPRGEIHLTERGEELAKSIIKRDKCLTRLLVDVCNMRPEDASPEVHQLEHLISDEVLFRLETLVEFASTSSGWLKRLHLRIETERPKLRKPANLTVGKSQVHQGTNLLED